MTAKGRITLCTGLVAAAMLEGCVVGPPLPVPVFAVANRKLAISGRAYPDKDGILVLGRVRRPQLALGPLWGHLHVTGLYGDRRAPLVVDTRFGTISPRGSRSASFTALLRTPQPSAIQAIRVEYRSEPDGKR